MINRNKHFITENNSLEGITSEELELLKKYKIKNYSFNSETKLIDVIGNVYLFNKKLIQLPKIRFGTITGDFSCSENQLTSLQYCPTVVGGDFGCADNQLTSLQYCPSVVGGIFNCGNNPLTSLQYCPSEVGYFFCSYTQLTDLKYCPSVVNGDFEYLNNNLKSIEDYPLSIIKGKFILLIIKNKITDIFHFTDILNIVKENPEKYIPFIETKDKIRFHQQIMRDDPSMIQYYIGTSIPLPKKASFI